MNEYGQVIDKGTERFERLLPGPVDRVWQYLTDSQLRGTWLATGAMEPRAGGAVTLRFHHRGLTDHDEPTPAKYKAMENGHTMVGRITRWDPPRHLAYTWEADSEVAFNLEPKGEDVLLTLTHRHLRMRNDMISVSSGWHSHLGVLTDRLRGEPPAPFWPRVERYEREYPQRIGEES